MYRLDIKWTAAYGDVDPDTGEPEITIEPVKDKPGHYLYYYGYHTAALEASEINGTLSEELNGIDILTFNVYHGSPNWDVFFPNRTSLQLWSDRRQDYVFSGRVISVEEHMDGDGALYKTVTCESEMAYLCDSICDMNEVLSRIKEKDRKLNFNDIIITMLELHDTHTGGFAGHITKEFYPPYCRWSESRGEFIIETGKVPYSMNNIEMALDGDVDTTYALLYKIFVEGQGWDIWVSHNSEVGSNAVAGYLVLNARKYSTATKETATIEVGKNMKSLSIEYSPTAEGRITRIVPLGGIGADGTRLTVRSIPQYHEGWVEPDYAREITNEILSITYGNVDKVVIYDDLVDDGNRSPEEIEKMIRELYDRGRREADALSDGITSISLSAADLSEAGYDVGSFNIGDTYRIVNPFFGLDDKFRLVQKTTDLSAPWDTQLVFARTLTTATSLTINRNSGVSDRIYSTGKMLSTRMDNTSVMVTTSQKYSAMTERNPRTVHYVDQGNGTYKAYMGDDPIVMSEGGGGTIEHAAIVTGDASELVVNRELIGLSVGGRSQAYYGGVKNKFYINNGLTVIFTPVVADFLEIVTETDLAMFNVGIQNQAGVVKNYDLLLYSITKNSNSSEFLTYIPSIYTQDRLGRRDYSNLVTTANLAKGPRTMGLVYRATSIQGPAAAYPYGRVAGQLHVVAFDLNGNVYSTSALATAQGSGSDIYPNYQNFRSQAEYDFALSMVTRSELTDGG